MCILALPNIFGLWPCLAVARTAHKRFPSLNSHVGKHCFRSVGWQEGRRLESRLHTVLHGVRAYSVPISGHVPEDLRYRKPAPLDRLPGNW